jgi:hypothetical protein
MPETVETPSPGRNKVTAGVREVARRPRRRWLRRLAAAAVGLLVVTVGLYGWAWSSVDRSTTARAIWWRDADVEDQYRFPARPIPATGASSPLPAGGEVDLPAASDDLLRRTGTSSFLVVHHDRLVDERYFDGADRQARQGLVGGVEDPVTRYLPELAARDPRFGRVTLRDLLTMSSGLRYWETDLPWPWTDDTYTYYGVDLRDVALNRTEVERPPGQHWQYNNYHPLLLGMVLERATGMPVSDYASTRLWRPLGAEADATWNLDSQRSGFEKLESGLNATPVDFARFGLLFLHDGEWNGRRIVSKDWVRAATAADTTTDPADFYQYLWWVDAERPGRFYALGNLGQYVYVAPDADAVIVRTGRDWGVDNRTWLATFRDVTDQLVRRP